MSFNKTSAHLLGSPTLVTSNKRPIQNNDKTITEQEYAKKANHHCYIRNKMRYHNVTITAPEADLIYRYCLRSWQDWLNCIRKQPAMV